MEIAELMNEPWCVAPSSVGSLAADAFRSSGLQVPRIAVTTTTAHLLFQLLESGRFVGHFGVILHELLRAQAIAGRASSRTILGRGVTARKIGRSVQWPSFFVDCAREVTEPSVKRDNPAKDWAEEDEVLSRSCTTGLRRSKRWQRRVQSSLVPENFNTLAHLSVSISTKLANGAGP